MSSVAADLAAVREFIERQTQCRLVKPNPAMESVAHPVSGCPRCQALLALDRIEAAR